MSQGWRWLSPGLVSVVAMGVAGCFPITRELPVQRQSLAADLAREATPRLARLQQPEVPALKVPVPMPPPTTAPLRPALPPPTPPAAKLPAAKLPATPLPATQLPATRLPAVQPSLPAPSAPKLPAPPPSPSGTQQTSLSSPRVNKITVRAWVNGRPIFDDEVMQNISPSALVALNRLPAAQQSEKLADFFNQTLDQLIEQEVIYQEAVRKLEKVNPTTLAKLRSLAEQDFEQQLRKVRDTKKVSDEQLKEFERQMRRQAERRYIAMQYMQSRIFQLINSGIGYQEIKDYYDAHPNEFQRVESVRWQNVFLAVGPKHPTLADARRFAEDLIARCRTGDDFIKLVPYDDGPSKFNNGQGTGSRRGEIQPPELEAHLFKLRDGQIGPIVALSTGVHMFRLVSRDPGGQTPLNEAVQNQIRNKLRNQLADREYRRIVRELKSRAVIEVERSAG
ncbi:MAG: peptidyl-prolyl cis-trans isomerase [Gemmataceae bacterium]|nr:peptidyl-prolyl cis-trans isomerase [Gemmataceae bacterium]